MRDAFAVKQTASAKAPAPRVLRAAALAGAAFAALALGGCLGYEGTHYRGYVIDAKTMDQVRVGASAEQVLVVMGTPSTTSTVGGEAWYYISQKTERNIAFQQPKVTDQRIFAVYFDKGKKVNRVANYGMEDGRVIDFVTRTTPTAGPESSFLRNMFTGLLRFN
ncbi:MAG: outer membrane protein assembly factor BamE [Beijerinckiaceae bacterium]|nr:outer membrane protein assembly factor BamE [Beijerinckiaceae bacterium]